MLVSGIDPAGLAKNPTAFAVIGDNTLTHLEILFEDLDIIEKLLMHNFSIVGIDAPLTRDFKNPRECDRLMKKYGAMPLKLKSITMLAERGMRILDIYRQDIKVNGKSSDPVFIEVFPTGSAKILGIYKRNFARYRAGLLSMLNKFGIVISSHINEPDTKDEIDAIVAAFTAWLHYKNLTRGIGDEKGQIIVPDNDGIERYLENQEKD